MLVQRSGKAGVNRVMTKILGFWAGIHYFLSLPFVLPALFLPFAFNVLPALPHLSVSFPFCSPYFLPYINLSYSPFIFIPFLLPFFFPLLLFKQFGLQLTTLEKHLDLKMHVDGFLQMHFCSFWTPNSVLYCTGFLPEIFEISSKCHTISSWMCGHNWSNTKLTVSAHRVQPTLLS
jgi:hypothetical protein